MSYLPLNIQYETHWYFCCHNWQKKIRYDQNILVWCHFTFSIPGTKNKEKKKHFWQKFTRLSWEFESCSWWSTGVLDTTLCDKLCQWLATGQQFSPVSSTNKIDHHNKEFLVVFTRHRFMVFKATFNNISVILWWSILLVEETGENCWPVASHWQSLSHKYCWKWL
jgi:hypothetical protein